MGSDGIHVVGCLSGCVIERRPGTGTKTECWPGPWFQWQRSWSRRKRFAGRDAELMAESCLLRRGSGCDIWLLERLRRRRYVGAVYCGHGRVRKMSVRCREVIRRKE